MKKVFITLLIVTMLISLIGCNASEIKATVINNNGETEYLSAKELAEIKDENSIAFEKNYWSCKVVVEGEVKEVTSSKIINGTYYSWTIKVEGGSADWFIGKGKYNESNVDEDFLATLSVGDTVKISGDIVGANSTECDISNGTLQVIKVK